MVQTAARTYCRCDVRGVVGWHMSPHDKKSGGGGGVIVGGMVPKQEFTAMWCILGGLSGDDAIRCHEYNGQNC